MFIESGHDLTSGTVNIPRERWHNIVLQVLVVPCTYGRHHFENTCGLRVLGIGSHDEVLGLGQVAPPVMSVIRLKKYLNIRKYIDHYYYTK
jgi:hypothetical protein